MRCDILTNWNVSKRGKCKRILCNVRLQAGCAVLKYTQSLRSKLIELADEKDDIMRAIANEVS